MADVASMTVEVAGRIEGSRLHKGVYYTRIAAPAPDSYTKPPLLEVRSKRDLGGIGTIVKVPCSLGGYGRQIRYADKSTGEQVDFQTAEMTLDAI